MSNDWVNADLFNSFLKEEEKAAEEKPQSTGPRRADIVYPTFERGKDENTHIKYVGRLLQNINTDNPQYAFKMRYYYHMFKNSEGKWVFVLCPKTWDNDHYCAFCSASRKLYESGSQNDKKAAPQYLRKEKYVANYYAIEDPRDAQRISDGKEKLTGKVWILEFPGKLNSKIMSEQKPGDDSRGMRIYDPGEKGYNMIVLVKSTKATKDEKTGNAKVFHDYNDSKFALNPSAIADTNEEISAIMATRHDIVAYVKSMERDIPDIVSILKDAMIWDLVKDEFKKKNKVTESKEETPVDIPVTPDEDKNDGDTPPWEDENTNSSKSTSPKKETTAEDNKQGDVDLEALLKEAGIDLN